MSMGYASQNLLRTRGRRLPVRTSEFEPLFEWLLPDNLSLAVVCRIFQRDVDDQER